MGKKSIIAGKDWDNSYRPEQYMIRDFLADRYPELDIKTELVLNKLTLDGKPYRGSKPDIAIVKEKIIIRINGMYHYTSSHQQLKDEFQKIALQQAGWYVIDFDCRIMNNLFKHNKSEKTFKLATAEIEFELAKHKFFKE